jgi:hypothetical protein
MTLQVIKAFLVILIIILIIGCANSTNKTSNNQIVLESYKAVLQNKINLVTDFISTDEKKEVNLNTFLTYDSKDEITLKITNFTILDMDADAVPEVILELSRAPKEYPEFYEVLHFVNGSVYGYVQPLRGFNNLKTDGSFRFSSGVSYNGYGKLRFDLNTCETEILGSMETNQNSDNVITSTYILNNYPVSEESYNSFMSEEERKKDAVWYEFSQKNIEKNFQ